MEKHPILAIMYDFDHTLSPRDMQEYGFIQRDAAKPRALELMSESDAGETSSLFRYRWLARLLQVFLFSL